ncbi:MAG: 30S ribosomal protein S5 [Candidatus Nomurabacteria bacterium]|jgi:small subunit ribosomal protein S5|nr:30S ribosomal protein S5 [Candidatus Nomurabacteria bacterium]
MAEEQTTKQSARAPRAPREGRERRREQQDVKTDGFEELTINIDRVARVVKGGRRFRFKALVAVGNKKGKIGVGVAKGQDVTTAITKAGEVARKHLITVPLNDTTIPHEVEVKHTGARVLLKPAAPGTGIIAGGVVRSVVELAGVTNLISKSLGSTNKVNIAYATIDALKSLVPRDKWVTTKNAPKKVAKETR